MRFVAYVPCQDEQLSILHPQVQRLRVAYVVLLCLCAQVRKRVEDHRTHYDFHIFWAFIFSLPVPFFPSSIL